MTIYLYKDGADAAEMRQVDDVSMHYSNLTPMQYAFLASFLFHRQSVPLEICNDILTLAGFVMIIHKDTTAFLRGYSQMNYCYLELPIPTTDLPQGIQVSSCCLCVVDISSHDQGWASSDIALNGTYEASYTWSELAIAETRDQEIVELTDRVRIGQNVRASHEFRHHRRALTPNTHASFLKNIKPGKWLRLYLLSQYPGWSNFANYGSIRVYFSLEATEEISLQNLPNDQISLQSSSRCAVQ